MFTLQSLTAAKLQLLVAKTIILWLGSPQQARFRIREVENHCYKRNGSGAISKWGSVDRGKLRKI